MKFLLRYGRLLGLLCGFVPALVWAQAKDNYPNRPIRIITGSPGSTSDLSARFVAQKLTERWGQQAVVDNRPGAGGIIGVEIGARAAPDGYTLIVGHVGTHASAQVLHKNLGYDPIKDFEPHLQPGECGGGAGGASVGAGGESQRVHRVFTKQRRQS